MSIPIKAINHFSHSQPLKSSKEALIIYFRVHRIYNQEISGLLSDKLEALLFHIKLSPNTIRKRMVKKVKTIASKLNIFSYFSTCHTALVRRFRKYKNTAFRKYEFYLLNPPIEKVRGVNLIAFTSYI